MSTCKGRWPVLGGVWDRLGRTVRFLADKNSNVGAGLWDDAAELVVTMEGRDYCIEIRPVADREI